MHQYRLEKMESGAASFFFSSLAVLLLSSCSYIPCQNTPADSQNNDGVITRIRSENNGSPTYAVSILPRKTKTAAGVTMDYMLHEPAGAPKALVVLIAGGQLDAGIVGSGGSVTSAGGNFLVRSAHLFAQRGYRVLTLDRPSDFNDFTQGSTSGSAYDGYRVSMVHAVDLSALINAVNTGNLDVLLAGTSRGAMSAVPNDSLGIGISLSSPVTSGGGTPINDPGSPANLQPSYVDVPAHVLWHHDDACSVSTPSGSLKLLSDLHAAAKDAVGDLVSGGFEDPASNKCRALTFHGFLGIESCAVGRITAWADRVLSVLETENPGNARPVATGFATGPVAAGATTNFSVAGSASDADSGDVLTFSTPYTGTSLGGNVAITGAGAVTYTAPSAGPSLTLPNTDTFVYVVADGKGGTSHNVVTVDVQ